MYTIICDGGCNKTGCYGSYVIFRDGTQVLELNRFSLSGLATNNEAEYGALIEAAYALIREFDVDEKLQVYTDSQLVCKQMNGDYKIKSDSLRDLNWHARSCLKDFFWEIRWVPREVIVGFLGH